MGSTSPLFIIDRATTDDIPALTFIINHAIRYGTAVWDLEPVTQANRREWLESFVSRGYPLFVARPTQPLPGWTDPHTGETSPVTLMGYAGYGPFHSKQGYQYTVENTIYLHPACIGGFGLGKVFLQLLLDHARSQQGGVHTMIASIAEDNVTSIGLHEKFGFKEVARMPQMGRKFGKWLGLVYLQYVFDDGSAVEEMERRQQQEEVTTAGKDNKSHGNVDRTVVSIVEAEATQPGTPVGLDALSPRTSRAVTPER